MSVGVMKDYKLKLKEFKLLFVYYKGRKLLCP
jgi:hypothetical protein